MRRGSEPARSNFSASVIGRGAFLVLLLLAMSSPSHAQRATNWIPDEATEHFVAGRYASAFAQGDAALSRCRAAQVDRSACLPVLTFTANAARFGGDLDTAEARARESVQIADGIAGGGAQQGSARMTLGEVFHEQRRFAEAEATLRDGIRLLEASLGAGHFITATGYSDLSVILSARGRLSEAEPLARAALRIRLATFGERNPDTAQSLANLAAVLAGLGRYPEAERLARQSLEIINAVSGSGHVRAAIALNGWATILGNQRRYAEAEPLLRQALTMAEGGLGETHPQTLLFASNLAHVLGRRGDRETPLRTDRRIFDAAVTRRGPQSPEAIIAASNLAAALANVGRRGEAEIMWRDSLARALARAEPDDALLARIYNNLAASAESDGRFAEAESLYVRARSSLTRRESRNDPDRFTAGNNYALLLMRHRGKPLLALKELRVLARTLLQPQAAPDGMQREEVYPIIRRDTFRRQVEAAWRVAAAARE